jgi:hypothetical protein
VQGAVEEIGCIAGFNDLPGIHHRHPVGQLAGGGDIVGDQDEADFQLLLDALEHVHDIGLGQHIQGRGGLVQDDQAGAVTSAMAIATRWRMPPESSKA